MFKSSHAFPIRPRLAPRFGRPLLADNPALVSRGVFSAYMPLENGRILCAACRRHIFLTDGGALPRTSRAELPYLPGKRPAKFVGTDKTFFGGLTKTLFRVYTAVNPKANKPMMRTSTQSEALSESRRRWDGGREESVEWTAEGGPNGDFPQ